MRTCIVWLRNDLRLRDNPALYQAAREFDEVVPVFIWAPEEERAWKPGGAQCWWLHHSLHSLKQDLESKGSRLIIRSGEGAPTLTALAEETGATSVFWNRRHVPALDTRDANIAEELERLNIETGSFEGRLLHDPDAIETTSGGPYHVYTPFWRKFNKLLDETLAATPPLPAADLKDRAPASWPESSAISALGLLPEARDGTDWAAGLRRMWTPGEEAGHTRLAHFLDELVDDYDTARDRPDLDGTSRLSPYLHHGELSPRQVWNAVQETSNGSLGEGAETFLKEIVWREFSYHLLHHYPETTTNPLKDKFANFPWEEDADALARWQQGKTGYPIIDAGMRQLYEVGWMHNRVRMIVASFLTKDLLIPWQQGARWFWDTLVDGDLASNTMGWQWAAGCGADAQPFFRIFNPVTQGQRHDPDGAYVKRYVPELADLPVEHLHAPWEAPAEVLRNANVQLGDTYPEPVVDHSEAREQALEAYERIK